MSDPIDKAIPSDDSTFEALIADARSGDDAAVEELMAQCRNYLLLIANHELEGELRRKLGPSDVVQESLIGAQAKLTDFRGSSREEFLAWIRQILIRDMQDARRRFKSSKRRQLDREVGTAGTNESGHNPVGTAATPGTDAATKEEAQLLTSAMEQLPENYQQIIRLRNWEELPFTEIGDRLDCSPDAARKLWSRAVGKLQEVLSGNWPGLRTR